MITNRLALGILFLFSTCFGTLQAQIAMTPEMIEVENQATSESSAEPEWELRAERLDSSDENAESTHTRRFQVLVRSQKKADAVRLHWESPDIRSATIYPESTDVEPNRWYLFRIECQAEKPSFKVRFRTSCQPESDAQTIYSTPSLDLLPGQWETCFRQEKSWPSGDALPENFFTEKDVWTRQTLPRIWNEQGITWIRLKFQLPQWAVGKELLLRISAVDDADKTYLNGHALGETNGWDVLREYPVRKEWTVKAGENELLIGVRNDYAGGGIKAGPIQIEILEDAQLLKAEIKAETTAAVSLFPELKPQHESSRQKPRPAGSPLPLRPLVVRDGVLEYEDGGEATLWGVNYYPQSWRQFVSLQNRNVDHKLAIQKDFDDFSGSRNGKNAPNDGITPDRFNVVRIHVFDTEISDGEGNLVRNEHLDVLDALVNECNRRGIYLWLTPIAWWGSPCQREDAFSAQIPMPAMTLSSETFDVQAKWMKQFLTHVNPCTKRRLIDEPCLVLFELINEPNYWNFSEIKNWNVEENERKREWKKKLYEEWRDALPGPEWENEGAWDFFCYSQVRSYIERMRRLIRSLGARQPVAYHAAAWATPKHIQYAIADSPCEAASFVFYTGLTQTPLADKASQLKKTIHFGIPEILKRKARLVYEFDASDTLHQIDLYPAIARYFRELGVQVACQFQYDSQFTADANQDWPTHYLNFRHTPEKIASFLIGGEVFRTLPRGTRFLLKEQDDELIFPPAAVSWTRNAAIFCNENSWFQARETDWRPLAPPKTPKSILAVGNSPYFDFEGNGLVSWFATENEAYLTVFPSVLRLRDDILVGSPENPLTKLEASPKTFRMKLTEWQNAGIERQNDAGEWEAYPGTPKNFAPSPGKYRFVK